MVASAVADYSKDRVEGENPLHLREREVCFGDCQKNFGIGNEIGSLLEHLPLPKGQIFGIGERNR